MAPAQSILTIDFGVEPAALSVVSVDERRLEVKAQAFAELGGLFTSGKAEEIFANLDEEAADLAPPSSLSSNSAAGRPAPEDEQATLAGFNGTPETYVANFKAALQSLGQEWSAAVVVAPFPEYLSLNLDLPFGDNKQVEKIIDLEVQDRIPFEVQEFLVEHRTLKELVPGRFDVHVSLTPKAAVRSLINFCRQAGIEPAVVSTPQSILEAFYHLAPDYFEKDSAIVYVSGNSIVAAFHLDGRFVMDRRLIAPDEVRDEGAEGLARNLAQFLRASIFSAEIRYQRPIGKIYLISETLNARDLQQILGRPVEHVRPGDVVQGSSPPSLGALGAPFARDINPPPILTNFRTREFSYHLQLGELISGFYKLLPFLGALIVFAALALTATYLLRERQIETLQDEMVTTARESMPNLTLTGDRSLADTLQAEINALERELEGLGSQSKFSPLDILAEITALIPQKPGVTLRNVTIRGLRVKITGNAPGVSDVEAIARALRNSQNIRFRVNEPQFSDARFGVGGGKEFTFDLAVRE